MARRSTAEASSATEHEARPRSASTAAAGALASAAEAIWVRTQRSPWSSLAVVPAGPGLPTSAVAEALAAVGTGQRGEAVASRDLRGVGLADSRPLVEMLADRSRRYQQVAAIDCPLDSQAALLLSSAVDAAILVVLRDRTKLATARRVLDLVGPSRFVGAVLVSAS
jgi:hypothetical protein